MAKEKNKKCCLCSRANYSVSIQYNKKTFIIPPMGKIELPDETKLGTLPQKVRKITIQEDK